jgi:hypothetical protein
MLQSSSPPHSVLGRRSRHEGDTDTEPDTVEPHALPEISNVSAAVMRYATKKKLRPEQRDDLNSFLTVSSCLYYYISHTDKIFQDTALGRTAKVFVNLLVLENKLDTIRSAAPAYQLSEELKVTVIVLNRPATNKPPRPISITTVSPSCYQSISALIKGIFPATTFLYVYQLAELPVRLLYFTGHPQEVSIRFASRHRTRLRKLGKNIHVCRLLAHPVSRQIEKIGK